MPLEKYKLDDLESKPAKIQLAIANELNRIAELMKIKLWFIMEADSTTTRQKNIIGSMLKEL